jgi:aminoglycoside phosphotransferase (APT) family kinase protein
VSDADRIFVVKRVLPKLRVQQDWYADTSRVNTEIMCLEYLGELLPEAAPQLIAARPEHGYLLMEYLGDRFTNWKAQLMRGQCVQLQAFKAGDTLGRIHHLTWGREDLKTRFNAMRNFQQLRLDPYFASLLRCHHDLRDLIENEIHQLQTNRLCLMHGDYSPKNLMFSDNRMVILDWEVACYADPAFDIGFLLNHLILKAVYRPEQAGDYLAQGQTAWKAYSTSIGDQVADLINQRLASLLPLLLLARIDGKSPVEYLDSPRQRELVRLMARTALAAPFAGTMPMCMNWIQQIKEWNNENNPH